MYRATDTKLNRDVAIKVLPEAFARDSERLMRFQREAQVLASLSHSSIATIFGIEEDAIVMELVEGPTLAERIDRGPIPLEEALAIARQIAEALSTAHDKGIIHRDLKPANVKVTPDGKVKVLDFGLAKLIDPRESAEDPSLSPTVVKGRSPTMAGVIMGTAGYMSPEQARGLAVDKRADIWAFGVVLHEMITGRQLFPGETVTDVLASVVKDQPDLTQVPASVRVLLQRCLEKDPKRRLRDIGDLDVLLEQTPQSQPAPRQSRSLAALAAVLFVALASLAWVHYREAPPDVITSRALILPPANTTLSFRDGLGLPAVSPDGRRIVFGAKNADGKTPLWVRPLDGLTAQPLANTEGASFPFWSPDSRFIAFFADGKLKKIEASGGPVITLADAPMGRGGSWSSQGVILFTPGTTPGTTQSERRILRVPASGGTASTVTQVGRMPWFLPDGRHFLYQLYRSVSEEPAICAGSLDDGACKEIGKASSNAIYSQGYMLFKRQNTLMAQPFDATALKTTAEAVPIAEEVQGALASRTVGVFSASTNGVLSYHGGSGEGGAVLTWFNSAGKQESTVSEPVNFRPRFALSPDGKNLASPISDGTNIDIWIFDLARGLRTRLTFDAAPDYDPVWSPDGRSIVFASLRKGQYDLYRKAANGSGAEELLYADSSNKRPYDWSHDGKVLLYQAFSDGSDIWWLPLTTEASGKPLKPFPVVNTPFFEGYPAFSPDGRWIAFTSNESGQFQVYVTAYPPGPGGKRQISNAGGSQPIWRRDGRQIIYRSMGAVMAADVSADGATFTVGQVHELFRPPPGSSEWGLEVSPDGKHFLLPIIPEKESSGVLTLIQNWTGSLRK